MVNRPPIPPFLYESPPELCFNWSNWMPVFTATRISDTSRMTLENLKILHQIGLMLRPFPASALCFLDDGSLAIIKKGFIFKWTVECGNGPVDDDVNNKAELTE